MTDELFHSECEIVPALDIEALPAGATHRLGVRLVDDGVGNPVHVPVLVARGAQPGPVFGITAAVHGNELNGIRVIHQLFAALDHAALSGTVVGCPVVNVPAYLANQRLFRTGHDLNRLMPGKAHGHVGQIYAHRLMAKIVDRFDYLIDLHTASLGRVNSLYVRANLKHHIARKMAWLQDPEIIVHNESADGTLRRAAMDRGIPAITVEVGNPLLFQRRLIRDSLAGLKSVLAHLKMIPDGEAPSSGEPVVCRRSYWIYAQHGGLLDVFPDVVQMVQKGERIARISNVFGDVVAEYTAPESGVVIGRNSNPICETGGRVLHLGVVGELEEDAGVEDDEEA